MPRPRVARAALHRFAAPLDAQHLAADERGSLRAARADEDQGGKNGLGKLRGRKLEVWRSQVGRQRSGGLLVEDG